MQIPLKLKWIEKTVSWHENGLLTDIEIEQFLKHLDKKKIIDLGSNVFENILTKESKYEI